MPRLKAANNAQTTLAANCTATDTVISVDDVSAFPDPPFRITIDAEIMEVTAVDYENKQFTVQRGLEGTTAAAHNAGAMVENRFTAGTFDELVDTSHRHTGSAGDAPPIPLDGIDAEARTSPGGTESNRLAVTDNDGKVGAAKTADELGGVAASSFARKDVAETIAANWTIGDNNQRVLKYRAIPLAIDTRTITLSYDSNGRLTSVTVKDGSTTVKTTTLTYDSNGNLTQVQETAGGTTVTTTLSYSNGRLTSVSKSVT